MKKMFLYIMLFLSFSMITEQYINQLGLNNQLMNSCTGNQINQNNDEHQHNHDFIFDENKLYDPNILQTVDKKAGSIIFHSIMYSPSIWQPPKV
jgi:hypothetical protein